MTAPTARAVRRVLRSAGLPGELIQVREHDGALVDDGGTVRADPAHLARPVAAVVIVLGDPPEPTRREYPGESWRALV